MDVPPLRSQLEAEPVLPGFCTFLSSPSIFIGCGGNEFQSHESDLLRGGEPFPYPTKSDQRASATDPKSPEGRF